MNPWTQLSVEYANQRNYLDDLFRVYPTIPEGIRDIDEGRWENVEQAFNVRNNQQLLTNLLEMDLFPLKDSYVAYLRRDPTAILRNPATVDRLCGRLYEMGLNAIYVRCSEPKETNRQIGPFFRRWLECGVLGVPAMGREHFSNSTENAILTGSDQELKEFAREHCNYKGKKGLDLVCRINGKIVIGEAKFLTDFGGHQNAQFNDAITTLKQRNVNARIIAILDGVLYIPGRNKMYKSLRSSLQHYDIMSALVLREFLYQV